MVGCVIPIVGRGWGGVWGVLDAVHVMPDGALQGKAGGWWQAHLREVDGVVLRDELGWRGGGFCFRRGGWSGWMR